MLLVFDRMCPVTLAARKYSNSGRHNFDIYQSISELVEDLAEQLDKMPNEEPAEANILKWKGFWADKIAPEQFEADTRAGAELRKTAVYQRMERTSRKG